MVYLVDIHALVWFLEGNPRLSAAAKAALTDPAAHLVLPTIVLAETAYLYARKRTGINVERVLHEIASAENCTVYPLDEVIASNIPGDLELHDAIIVATALIYRDTLGETVAIVTKDERITRSGIVTVVW